MNVRPPSPELLDDWEFLPFRFERIGDDEVVLTNMVGEHLLLTDSDFDRLVNEHKASRSTMRDLRSKHIVRGPSEAVPIELLAAKVRTRHRRLSWFTGLHMFVVSLRCEHACPYCQVSRQNSAKNEFDMSPETASASLDLVFRSPSPLIKIELQGGEPLLNFELVRAIVDEAEARNVTEERNLAFVIATNLALLDDEVIEFAREHNIGFSTSLDGPRDLHNANRPRPGRDSWERAISGIRRIQNELGHERVTALMTTTERTLDSVHEVIDAYIDAGLNELFLRPLSPYGFAIKTGTFSKYEVERWLDFYEAGLDYILEQNFNGRPMIETYASIVLRKMLTNDDPGYVDLMSPAGTGIAAVIYNYDGDVYASDEGRMLAEMGDHTFRLGNVHSSSYEEIFLSDGLLEPLEASFTGSAPMCSDCAFEPWCGADPVYHHATMGDPVGIKPLSAFCARNMGVFKLLLDRYENDSRARSVFEMWANR